MDIIITIPKTTSWEDYKKEIRACETSEDTMMCYKVHNTPLNSKVGDRCYVVYCGKIVGWMNICYIGWLDRWKCTTTQELMSDNYYICRNGQFHYLEEDIPMKSFRGWRYFNYDEYVKSIKKENEI